MGRRKPLVFNRQRWIKGHQYTVDWTSDRQCLAQQIGHQCGYGDNRVGVTNVVADVVRALFPERAERYLPSPGHPLQEVKDLHAIASFNDDPDTTPDQIEKVLAEANRRLEEEED